MLVCDVGPRDGLQNDPVTLSPERRAELCDRLARAGVERIEAASFVNPKKVPQMAGAEDVLAQVDRSNGTQFAGLVLNERGYDRARESRLDHVEYAVPVTDTFAERNQGVTLRQALEIGERVIARAREDGAHTGVTLSVAFGCPFEGAVDPATVARVAEQVAAWQPDELGLADTIGVGVPTQVRELLEAVTPLGIRVRGHFHNTRNTGYANAVAAVESGVEILDASVGGTGGCPFAPNATGNIASEDLVYLLHGMGVETGVDLDALIDTANWLHDELDHELPGMLRRAGPFPEEHRGGNRNGS